MLHYNFYEAKQESNTLLIMLHGFISDQHAFDQHVDSLVDHFNIVTIDLPGHGEDNSNFEYEWSFDFINQQLDDTLKQFESYQLFLHGYSMGGRVALNYALTYSDKLKGLILESTSPGIAQADDKEERIQVDNARAKVLDIAGLEIFVNDWEKLPLFYTQYELPQEVRKRIRDMRMRQQPQRLAKALRDYGTGQMPNLWPKLSQLTLPTCLIVGELDKKFIEIASKMEKELNTVQIHEVSNSGHTVHVEDEVEFDKIVLGFIQKEEQND